MSLIEHERAKAIDAMTRAIGVRSKVRDSISDMLDAALDSGALVWASNHQEAVGRIAALERERDELAQRLRRASANAEAAEAEVERLTGGQ
jgi:hypothetical protein